MEGLGTKVGVYVVQPVIIDPRAWACRWAVQGREATRYHWTVHGAASYPATAYRLRARTSRAAELWFRPWWCLASP